MLGVIKNLIRGNPKISNLLWSVRALWGQTPQTVNERYYRPRTRHIIDHYLASSIVKKLHIGAQNHVLEGWLNVDIFTGASTQIAYMDASKPFPLEDASFDYVFSEHMIEHISFEDARRMMTECYRILKPGGKIRIATPGMDKILNASPDNKDHVDYFDTIVKPTFPKDTELPFRTEYIINYMVYNFGHRFIYTKNILMDLLESCHFKVIDFYEPQISNDINLIDIEGHAKNSSYLCDAETINIEAFKHHGNE